MAGERQYCLSTKARRAALSAMLERVSIAFLLEVVPVTMMALPDRLGMSLSGLNFGLPMLSIFNVCLWYLIRQRVFPMMLKATC